MVLGSNPITVFTSRIQSIGGLISDGVKTESFDLPKEIDIEIDYSIGGFIIKQTDDDKASITFPYSENNDFEIKTEVIDQKFTVKFVKHRSSWLSFGSFNIEDTILNLPKDTKITDLDVDLKLGSLTMIEIKSDQSQIKLNMGSLDDLSGIHQKANWKLNMGSIKLRGTQLDNAKLDLDMGSLEGKTIMLGTQEIEVNMGSVELVLEQELNKASYNIQVDLGDISVNGQKDNYQSTENAEVEFKIDANMGSVKLRFMPD